MAHFFRTGRRARKKKRFREKAFGAARRWSNNELRAIASLFTGRVVNVSAWQDRDKEGAHYADYFSRANSYHITNFGTSQGQIQHVPHEFFLDLEKPLDPARAGGFDVVFNHTTLEHIWDFRTSFANLCGLSRDIVILVVPWLQPMHSDYGDFWRFSPQALIRLFEEQRMAPLSITWNATPGTSVYVFAVATKNRDRWAHVFRQRPLASSDKAFYGLPPRPAGSQVFD